jgi:hypothetical protein
MRNEEAADGCRSCDAQDVDGRQDGMARHTMGGTTKIRFFLFLTYTTGWYLIYPVCNF